VTALPAPARREEDARLKPVPWRRMAWVTWRQHRTALAGVAVFLGAVAAGMWLVGLQVHHAYAAAAACHPAASIACSDLASSFNHMALPLFNGYPLQAVPALIGAFAGAPLLARELETGTFRYAWTQGFGRARWTLAKLVPLAVAVTAGAGALTVLLSWYYQPYRAGRNFALSLNEVSPLASLFVARGVDFAAWTLAAFAIGVLAGVLARRVVPAVAATLAACAGLAAAAGLYLREHYLAPLVTSNSSVRVPAWILSRHWTKGGHPVSQSVMGQVFQREASRLAGGGRLPRGVNMIPYVIRHGYTQWTTYQPASRFWPFQWIESGWLLALSVLLIGSTVWLVRRRVT
jgi:hypothetical protein